MCIMIAIAVLISAAPLDMTVQDSPATIALDAGSLPASTQEAPDSTVFPASDQLTVVGAHQLALTISTALAYEQPLLVGTQEGCQFHPHVIQRVVDSQFDSTRDLVRLDYTLGGNGTLSLYYNRNNEFIGFASTMPDNSSRTVDYTEYDDSALLIGAALDIPASLLAAIELHNQSFYTISLPSDLTDWDPELPYQGGIVQWHNSSLVVAHSLPALDLVPSGCNALGLEYDNDTGCLILVEGWRFVELPTACNVSSDESIGMARGTLSSYLYTEVDVLVSDRVNAVRLDAQSLRFSYQYEALMEIPDENTSYSVLLLVDIDTGTILYSDRTLPAGPWIPMVHTFSWLPLTVSLILTVVVVGICISLSPEFALLFMGSYFVLAYIRLRGASILDNFNRGRIMGFISALPGASFTDIREALKIANGNLAYHLCVLEKLELISSSKDGRSRRYYPAGVEHVGGDNQFIGKTESQILDQLGKNGPLSNAAIAGSLGMSRQRTYYNLRLLQRRGLIDRQGPLWQIKLGMPESPPKTGASGARP